MAKPIKFDESSDNDDLQALFDSIAAGSEVPMHATKPPPEPALGASGDSDDLQALFDSVSAQVDESAIAASPVAADHKEPEESSVVFSSLGQMTRELHDSLRDIGHDQALGDAARGIPDARQRLSYIVQMTEQAASRALNAIEIAKPIQDAMQSQSEALGKRWGKVFANQLSAEEFKVLAADTHTFLSEIPKQTRATNEQLTEIMMAQDFQDLTGQVIKKVVDLVENLERQLLHVLFEAMPPEMNVEPPAGLLNGPVINANGRADVVNSQSQVDDLLESLGF
ncbi:MAG: protein phosphatase CheZ [Proteobacteria bacterium]|nr:protein phosphatase CheZ [Pseudomonadota bacterium]